MSRGRVLVAMSGGVDSCAAAYLLLQQGYECIGATMRLAPNEDDRPGERTCCSADDVADARAACWALGIRHHVFDYTRQFEQSVIKPFVARYLAGGTPNPCVACNRHLKFGALLDRALELGCDYLATGHYARVERLAAGHGRATPRYRLLAAADASKDQSYFLSGLTQEQLSHVLFPLGGLIKETQVRPLAGKAGLEVAHKKDSEGVCFVPGGDHLRFIKEYAKVAVPAGDVLDTSGNVIGRHQGALRYTIGQRKGLGVASTRPLYVCETDVVANTVTLGDTADLMRGSLVANDWNWACGGVETAFDVARQASGGEAATGSFRARAKVRYRQPAQACTATPLADGGVRLDFDEPQRAIACGQVAVLYCNEEVLGGGVIESTSR